MADVERVKDMVALMGGALAECHLDYTASEVLSAEATLFLTTARVIIERAPEAREGIIAMIQHMLLTLTETPIDKKLIN
jgi:hypothetical protein